MLNQSTLTWIVIFLLVLIIVLLSICLYFDIRVLENPIPSVSTTAPKDSTPKPPTTTKAPPTTTKAPSTTAAPPVTDKPTVTTAKKPPVTNPPVTTAKVPTTTKIPTTEAPVIKPLPTPDPNAPTICIDPGHGFGDPGALGTLNGETYYESDINLEIAMKLKDALLSLGYNVVMTHDGKTLPADKYLSTSSPKFNVNNRCQFIKDNISEIDLVVSVHCNTASSSAAKGSRYYILPFGFPDYNHKSEVLALSLIDAVFASFSLASKPNYYTQDLAVLKSGLPSVLVECGFMTNTSDLTNLLSQWWQNKYVTALASGIDAYCKANIQ